MAGYLLMAGCGWLGAYKKLLQDDESVRNKTPTDLYKRNKRSLIFATICILVAHLPLLCLISNIIAMPLLFLHPGFSSTGEHMNYSFLGGYPESYYAKSMLFIYYFALYWIISYRITHYDKSNDKGMPKW